MFLTPFLTDFVAVGIATVLLLAFGHRVRYSSRMLGIVLGAAVVAGAGEVVSRVWELPAEPVLGAQAVLLGAVMLVALARPYWNSFGQVFFATFLASAVTYVGFAGSITFAGGLSGIGLAASVLLLVLELFALMLSAYFVFEGCDVVCRTKPIRPEPAYDPSYRPKVSLQIPAYNEPPDMLIETIKSVDSIDYPSLEVIVIDNNTKDPDTWRPVEEFCRDRPRVTFVHVDDLPGFKSGALNHVMREHMDPAAELIGVIDADYRVDPNWLNEVVGYFVDDNLAFLQTPQDYREHEGDAYLTSCYDAYNYFFCASMPFRNQRNSIIFAGTMGLIRRSSLEAVGNWPEWCITEDAETSLRILKKGYSGLFIPKAYGKGIMPLTFAALKSQRFRWAFGGIQILKKHFWHLLPGPRTKNNRLTLPQRFDYLISGFIWFNDVLYLGFSLVLLATAAVVLSGSSVELRPLRGAIILLPAALIASGVIRALWSLRVRMGISLKRAFFAFVNWLSLSWTVALACLQHLFRSKATFLRTPKEGKERTFLGALRAARMETFFTLLLWGCALTVVAAGLGTAFLITLFVWQGFVYACATLMSWLNVRSELSARLEERRQTEHLRERVSRLVPYYVGAAALAVGVGVLFAMGAQQGGDGRDLFEQPSGQPTSPLRLLSDRLADGPSPTPSPSRAPTPSPAPEATATPAATASPATATPDSTPRPTVAPSATPTVAPAAAPTATVAP